jgi:hypothetical protein
MTATKITYESAALVAPPPMLPTITRMNPDSALQEAFAANNGALADYLRAVVPMPSWRNDTVIDAEPQGIAAPHEAHERTRRYGWTLLAIVILAIVATGGLAFTGYQLGMIPHVGLAVTIWIGAGGMLAIFLVQRLQHADMEHSPEAIALVRERAGAFATETAAEASAGVAAAWAYAIRSEANAKSHQTQAQAAALDAEVQRLMLAAPSPQPRRPAPAITTEIQPQPWHLDADGNPQPGPDPVPTPVATPVATPVVTPVAPPVAPGVPPVTATVLSWIANLYDDPAAVHPDTRRVLAEVPWSARSKALPEAEKARIKAAVLGLDLFEPAPGNGLILAWRFKWSALQRVKAVL